MKFRHCIAFAAGLVATIAAVAPLEASNALRNSKRALAVQAVPSEQLWHLRAGLNVAALSCRGRGRESVAPAYSRLLKRHRGLLASAYSLEQRKHGGRLDRHQTELYNRFAFQRSPERFCANAADVADRAVAMDSPTLAKNARTLLSQID